jgi:hypothetical protein
MATLDHNSAAGTGADVSGDALHVKLRDGATGATLTRANRSAVSLGTIEGLPIMGVNDDSVRMVRVDRFGNQGVALHSPLFSEPFETTTINTQRVLSSATTFVPAQTALGWNANSTNLTTANAVASLVSRLQFPKQQRIPLQAKFRLRTSRLANVTQEIGFGAPTGTAVPANGAFVRMVNDTANLVLAFNGGEASTVLAASLAALSASWDSEFFTFDVLVDDDEATATIQDTSTGAILAETRIQLPKTANRLWAVSHLPVFARQFIGGIAAVSAPAFVLADLMVTALDANASMDAPLLAAVNELTALANPTTGVQLPQFTNSTAPANATLANATAGYATLGGFFQFAAVAGAATDYALFGFQIPAPYQFVCTGIEIETYNTGAAVATTPTLLVWGVASNLTAVSLATAAHLRKHVGAQSLPIGAAVGAKAERIAMEYKTPIVCEPGLFFDVVLRMPVATATASQVIAGFVSINGYFR